MLAAGGAAAVTAGVIAGAGPPTLAAARPAEVPIAGSVAPFTGHSATTGPVGGARRLTLQLWLKPGVAAAQAYANAASTPGGPAFRHYLTPAKYTARFGASAAAAAATESWLRGQGFTAVATDGQRNYVRATAPAATIDKALRTTLRYYQPTAQASGGEYRLYANDKPVTLPATIAADVLGVTGLDNAAATDSVIRPRGLARPSAPCSRYFGQHKVSGLPKAFGTTTFATSGCGYTAAQMRAAYGMNKASSGRGQAVALVELGQVNDMFLTLKHYARANHLPAPSTSRYSEVTLGRGSQCGNFSGEEQLDVEASYAMAPAIRQVVVGGDSCDNGDAGMQGLFDADIAVIDGDGARPLATIASNSWGSENNKEAQPGDTLQVAHAYFVRAATEGVGMYFGIDDVPGAGFPTDPYSINVGGTSVAVRKNGRVLFETGWSTGEEARRGKHWGKDDEIAYGTGGGTSHIFAQPAYQRGVVPPALSAVTGHAGPMRATPDLSADADPGTGMLIGTLSFPKNKAPVYREADFGGNSLASPLVAGMVADAQQGQPEPFGFTNPVFYSLYGTSAFRDVLPLTSASPAMYRAEYCVNFCPEGWLAIFDAQSKHMRGYTGQVTLPGYDTMTGIGTPNGQAFIRALRLAGT
jgi:subtilase family serine protease